MSEWIIGGFLAAIAILLLLVIRLSINLGRLEGSIAKLGFVIREDAKKYFDEAAHAVVGVNEDFQSQNSRVIREGTKAALEDAGSIMERSISEAQHSAVAVVLEAREEAMRIVEQAKRETDTYKQRALDQSTATIQWTLEQYMAQKFTVEQHEMLIKKLLDRNGENGLKGEVADDSNKNDYR